MSRRCPCGAWLKKGQTSCFECDRPVPEENLSRGELVERSAVLIHLIQSAHGGPSRKFKKRKTL